ncbi:MAG: hypothetical protein KJ914_13015 [Gammaproteobacteria bacterium]|nr:hypothetical protein [Gammaproteobacteria bacterium]MBU1724850.1 hypothetical protein [Gammaproteobacteria bacterium]MBU2005034.1 hypothetical protein [Gammaproteobacteria bacterium]
MEINHPTIQAELERILASRCFRSRRTLRNFLSYIVNESLAGRQEHITQYAIATKGLGKPADFSELESPLVRVQAGRLRAQLEEYYATEGRFDTLRITLPPRSYQPVFTSQPATTPRLPVIQENVSPSLSHGPGIVCIPRNFAADETVGWPFITRLTRDYVNLLTHFSFCQTVFTDETSWQQSDSPEYAWRKYGADFALFFDLHAENDTYKLTCSLGHSQNNQPIWEHTFKLGESYPDPALLNPIFKRIAHDTISYDPGITHTHWTRQILGSGKPVASHHSVLTAVRQYIWEPTPQTFRTSFHACEQRLEKFPHDTQALLVYAIHCFAEYGLKFNIVDSPQSRIAYATDALLQLAPGNPYSHAYHALACLLEDDDEQCRKSLEKAQSINHLDSYLNVQTGLLYLAMEEWQKGAWFIQDSINVSQLYPDWYHIPLSICHYREGRYLAAMQEAQKVRVKHLWTPMLRTALYQCNQKLQKGIQEYRKMLNDYPDFTHGSRKIMDGFPQPKVNNILSQLWSHLPHR